MKRLLPLFAVALACWMTNSAAADLNIKFTGKFLTSTCSFTVPDTDLGTYGAWTFTGVGYFAAWSANIPITASNCTSDITTVHMTFNGTADTKDSQFFKAVPVAGQGNISGVGIDLSTVTGGFNRIIPNYTLINWNLASVGNTYSIKARFTQTLTTVTPGRMKAPITIQFTYN
nr:fimbrial protein [Dyella sp. ASV24]